MNSFERAREIVALIKSAPTDELACLIERYQDDPRQQVAQAVASARRKLESSEHESQRTHMMYQLQSDLALGGIAIGIDEVGRGAVAGPLTVAAVILDTNSPIYGLNDSKKLTPQKREVLSAQIAQTAHAIGIAHIAPQVIDERGMGYCLHQAMSEALASAEETSGITADAVLIDGNPMHIDPRETTIVKGDARVACIAAASIVAKVARDSLMCAMDEEYPGYFFAENKGYASAAHIQAIREKGLSSIHRASFCGNFLETPSLF